MATVEKVGSTVLLLTNLTHCQVPHPVQLTYGSHILTLWMNGSTVTSPAESQCIFISISGCPQNNDTMELTLYVNPKGCLNTVGSTIVAEYVDTIQKNTCINVPGLLILPECVLLLYECILTRCCSYLYTSNGTYFCTSSDASLVDCNCEFPS